MRQVYEYQKKDKQLGGNWNLNTRLLVQALEEFAAIKVDEAAQQSEQPTEPTCAICSEPAKRHHPEDGGHEFRR